MYFILEFLLFKEMVLIKEKIVFKEYALKKLDF